MNLRAMQGRLIAAASGVLGSVLVTGAVLAAASTPPSNPPSKDDDKTATMVGTIGGLGIAAVPFILGLDSLSRNAEDIRRLQRVKAQESTFTPT